MDTWKEEILKREEKVGKKFLSERRRYNRVLVKYRKVNKSDLKQPVRSFQCAKRPDGDTYCLVGNDENKFYVPIEKKEGKCSICLHGHPCIDMTKRCGTDVARDKKFHGKEAQKIWNKECEFDENDNLKQSDRVCKKNKSGKCVIS